jgi:branched-subunit amino acid ABC-type transport system permease component
VIEFIVVQTLNGLVYSMLLFVLALGLSMTFGLLGFVNLAHGSFFLLGAYVGLTVAKSSGSFVLAALAGAAAAGATGLLLERLSLRHFYRRSDLDQVILSFGFALVFVDIAKMIWGRDVHGLGAPSWLAGAVNIGAMTYPAYRLALIAIGILLFVAVWLGIERTRAGALVRASVADRDMVSGIGFDVRALFTLVFAFGALLAGLGGVLAAPITGIYQGLDFEVLITTLIVVVVGGLGSISGAFWASILIGVADTFGRALIPETASFLIFGLMALVLLIRSWGQVEEDID